MYPEVRDTAYRGATVRHLLDMRVGILFDEDYMAADGPIIAYRRATGWNPPEPDEPPSDLRSFCAQLTGTDGLHGQRFHYVSTNTDLLAWVIERATGERYADLMSRLLWAPAGAERPAYITVDRLGAPRAAGGMCVAARDLARIGLLIVGNGRRDGRQVLPERWIDDIERNGDPEAWDAGDFAPFLPGRPMHYRSQCYVLRGEKSPDLRHRHTRPEPVCGPARRSRRGALFPLAPCRWSPTMWQPGSTKRSPSGTSWPEPEPPRTQPPSRWGAGSTARPCRLSSKWSCGVVTRPLLPTSAIRCPRWTSSPRATSRRSLWA